MELKLNIYDDDDKIIKTYTCESFKLKFGVVEDLIGSLNLEGLKSDDNVEFIKTISKVVVNSFDTIKPILKKMFKGVTDEELRNTDVSEVVTVVMETVKYSISQITKGSNGKN